MALMVAASLAYVVTADRRPMAVAPSQPLSSALFLPSTLNEPEFRAVPDAVASLGHSVQDALWLDGVLYAALGQTVVAFEARTGGEVQYLGATGVLPGAVLDLAAGEGVVYAAYMVSDSWRENQAVGGLAVVARHVAGDLRVLGTVALTPGSGYSSVAADGATLVGVHCMSEVCDRLDVIDVSDPSSPRLADTVAVATVAWPDWTRTGVVALGNGRFTNGTEVVDASAPGAAEIVGRLEEPGYPVEGDGFLVTATAEQLNLYRRGEIALPELLDYEPFEVGHSGVGLTAAAIIDGRLLAGGPLDVPYEGSGMWVQAAIGDAGFGPIETAEAAQIPGAFTAGAGEMWVALNAGYTDFSPLTLDPYQASIAVRPLDSQSSPGADLTLLWTGWEWRTLDVLQRGGLAYALVESDSGGPGSVDLLTYDVTYAELPRLLHRLSSVCEIGVDPDWIDRHRPCSLAQLTEDTLAVSSRLGSAIVGVADPESPMVIRSQPSLGLEVARVPDGLVGLMRYEWPASDDEIVGYSLDQAGMPVKEWTIPIHMDAIEFAVDSNTGLMAAGDQYAAVWAGRASGSGVSQATTLDCLELCFGLASAGDRLYWIGGVDDLDDPNPGLAFVEYGLTEQGLADLGRTAFVLDDVEVDDASVTRPVVWDGMYGIGLGPHLAFVDVRLRGEPRMVGSKPYGPAHCELNPFWCDESQPPFLAGVGSHLYVTMTPFGQVWR